MVLEVLVILLSPQIVFKDIEAIFLSIIALECSEWRFLMGLVLIGIEDQLALLQLLDKGRNLDVRLLRPIGFGLIVQPFEDYVRVRVGIFVVVLGQELFLLFVDLVSAGIPEELVALRGLALDRLRERVLKLHDQVVVVIG